MRKFNFMFFCEYYHELPLRPTTALRWSYGKKTSHFSPIWRLRLPVRLSAFGTGRCRTQTGRQRKQSFRTPTDYFDFFIWTRYYRFFIRPQEMASFSFEETAWGMPSPLTVTSSKCPSALKVPTPIAPCGKESSSTSISNLPST